MTTDDSQHESFEAFKNSFFYGSRCDLNFKFLENLSDRDAARFIQELFRKVGESLDDGDLDRIVDHVYEWQVRGYAGVGRYDYKEGPFARPRRRIPESRVALVTSSGHFVEGRDPEPFGVKNMTQREAIERIEEFLKAEPQLSSVPIDTPSEKLRLRHGGYDISGAQADPNVVFPLERLVELRNEGAIGELAAEAYSFVGAASQARIMKQAGPKWAKLLREGGVDCAVLVPV